MKKEYKYQMHMHTLPCSKCAKMTMEEAISALKEAGYAGGVITNHFFCGNSAISREIPYKDFIAEYEKDYLLGQKIAKREGMDLLFGIEEWIGSYKEILCYGITPQFLYERTFLLDREYLNYHNQEIWYKELDSVGALCIQAHPFRKRAYHPENYKPGLLDERYLHGFETINYCNTQEENELACIEASKRNMIYTSGSDAHNPQTAMHTGIKTDAPIHSSEELALVLKSGKYEIIKD